MAYATVDEVAGEFKGITFSATSAVSSDRVEAFIAEADAEIDSMLSAKYEVPITGASALLLVRRISLAIVSDRIREIIAAKGGDAKTQQKSGESASALARKHLEEFAQGKRRLVDATLISSNDGIESYSSNDDLEPIFDYETDQW